MEVPRPLRAGELPSLVRLLTRTFRSRFPGDFGDEYPHILNEANLERSIVISEGGEIVSHVGMAARRISFEGVPLAVALVGGVATAEECRGRGCATRCLDFALDQAAREGDDLAWISGSRGLYTSRGAAQAGREWVYRVAAGRKTPEGITIREFSPANDPAAAALCEREPVRFLRHRDDWARAAKNRFVMNWKSRFWGVLRADRLCAYLVVHEPRADRPVSLLADFAGDRTDAARALPEAASRMGVAVVEAHVGDWDRAGREAFAAVALADGKLEAGRGTFLPLRMAPCMEKLRPRIARLCGEAITGQGLRFSESGGGPGSRSGADARLHIRLGPDEARIAGRAELARLLFGAPDSNPTAFEGAASVLERLQPAFPLPTPWYGLNFV
jgi:predicted N-acetyltransferase YhbS